MSTVTLGGNPVEVAGKFPQPGDTAPPLSLTGADLNDVTLAWKETHAGTEIRYAALSILSPLATAALLIPSTAGTGALLILSPPETGGDTEAGPSPTPTPGDDPRAAASYATLSTTASTKTRSIGEYSMPWRRMSRAAAGYISTMNSRAPSHRPNSTPISSIPSFSLMLITSSATPRADSATAFSNVRGPIR